MPLLLAIALLIAGYFTVKVIAEALADAWRTLWTSVVQIAEHAVTAVGMVICVLGALAALVALVYVIGTFAERMHRSHLYARHRREELAMDWDRMIMMRYPEGPEDFDG
jgi:hypothetical protein